MGRSKINTMFLKKMPEGVIFKGRALSDSMEPLIMVGETVIVEKSPFNLLKKGDVVAFNKSKDKLQLHRIIAINFDTQLLTTKGDNITIFDKPINKKEYLGKAIYAVNLNRKLPLSGWRPRLFGWSLKNKFPEIPELELIEKLTKKILKVIIFFPEFVILR